MMHSRLLRAIVLCCLGTMAACHCCAERCRSTECRCAHPQHESGSREAAGREALRRELVAYFERLRDEAAATWSAHLVELKSEVSAESAKAQAGMLDFARSELPKAMAPHFAQLEAALVDARSRSADGHGGAIESNQLALQVATLRSQTRKGLRDLDL